MKNTKRINLRSALSAALMVSSVVATPLIQAETAPYIVQPSTVQAEYTNQIPTVQQVLGYASGSKITNHSDMIRYFEALSLAAPDRVKLFDYGVTWEGRRLIYLAISNKSNIDNLDSFAENMQRLSDPRKTTEKQARELIDNMPSSVWLGYSVHGNEISGTDAAMRTAYHLLAASNDKTVNKILDNTVVFIDPLQNPDGRTRFTSRYYATVGLEHSSDRLSAEHNEPWPRGRSNHYLFDMNRDWLAVTQPETKGRIAAINEFRPLVVIDLHEMGGDQSYYFAPAAKPFNPHMTDTQVENMNTIGANIGKYFDQDGYDYFTREIFDAFYPGYGDSWPTFYGASASTYEVSSSRGERYTKTTGELLTYDYTVQRHFVASIATAEGVADNRKKLLNDYYQYQVTAIESGKGKERIYVLNDEVNRAGSHRLATLMAQHDVEVKQATESFKLCGNTYPTGTYFIDSAQPKGRFVTTTMTEQVNMSEAFIKEQERRRARNLNDEIYDVTGWSLPLMFGVDVDTCKSVPKVKYTFVTPDQKLKGQVENLNAKVGYIIPWGDMAAGRFLTHALKAGLTVKTADKSFTLDGKQRFPAGSIVIEKRQHSKDLPSMISSIAAQTGAKVIGIDTSWVTDGPSLGSGSMPELTAPRVAMAWDEPVSSLSAGHTRFVIERQFDYPVTAIRTNVLRYADLSNYQVLILPHGYYENALGKGGAENLKQWVKNGGVLITFAGATKFASNPDYAILDVQRERAVNENPSVYKDSDSGLVDGVVIKNREMLKVATEEFDKNPDFVAGVLANVEVDQEHWLTAGIKPNVVGIAYGSDIFTPIKLNSGKNLAWFSSEDKVLASGYLWEESKKQLAYKPFLIHQPMGKGMVIAYTQEPTTRAYLDGLNVMLMNSIFRAAAHASPLKQIH